MSANSVARQASQCRDIPSRRVIINDASQLPSDYCTTPGGTIFSTTPGGTRIIYDRAFLLQMRNSPMAKTPPKNLPNIPGVTCRVASLSNSPKENGERHDAKGDEKQEHHDEPQFEMDI
uniref:TIF-4E n=2 Tax=Scolopendridae TaxID=41363 RepID=A0A646QG41_9MYRI